MNLVTLSFAFGPLRKLLRQPAVIGHIAVGIVGKPFAVHVHFHALISRNDFGTPHIAFHRSLRMQRELRKLDREIITCFEFLDTPGDEITPGSDKVRKHFENERFGHNASLLAATVLG